MATTFPDFVPPSLIKDGWWLSTTSSSGIEPPQRGESYKSALTPYFGGIGCVLALLILSDWLFWGRYLGISLTLFGAAIVGFSLWMTRSAATHHAQQLACLVFVIASLPSVIAAGMLPFLFLLFGTVSAVLILHARLDLGFAQNVRTYLWFLGTGPAWIILDAFKPAKEVQFPKAGFLNAWMVPLGLGAVFLSLFARANPILETVLVQAIDLEWLENINLARILFWTGMLFLCWPFVNMRQRVLPQTMAQKDRRHPPAWFDQLAIRNALALFNGLFALQTALDISYLWSGADLPEGMTYAGYAHRGAYPLMFTALLAGVFMLAATSFGAMSRINRRLLSVWIGQNVILVMSSALRLKLYVSFYSLTYLRLAAFIWMGLVIVGLLLIAYRLWFDRSNAWALKGMALMGAGTLYLACFVNFASVIGDYNVTHSREISGEGLALDRNYLCTLGARAYPAADRFLRATGSPVEGFHGLGGHGVGWLAGDFWRHQENWRDWGLRDHLLARYLRDVYGE